MKRGVPPKRRQLSSSRIKVLCRLRRGRNQVLRGFRLRVISPKEGFYKDDNGGCGTVERRVKTRTGSSRTRSPDVVHGGSKGTLWSGLTRTGRELGLVIGTDGTNFNVD